MTRLLQLWTVPAVCSSACVGTGRPSMPHAALGNSLDFFKNPTQALADIPDQFRNGISFYYDNLAQLEAFLATRPQHVLYLTDNAGEVYFDIPFYDYLKQHCGRVEEFDGSVYC